MELRGIRLSFLRQPSALVVMTGPEVYFERTDFNGTQSVCFNAPIESINITCDVPFAARETGKFSYKLPDLPKPDHNLFTGNVPALIEANVNQMASIYPFLDLISVAPKFNGLSYCEKAFILCHEFAHYWQESEEKTDVRGLWLYLKMGLPPISAYYALMNHLNRTDDNILRMYNFFEFLEDADHTKSK
jgi:hypothetical protein